MESRLEISEVEVKEKYPITRQGRDRIVEVDGKTWTLSPIKCYGIEGYRIVESADPDDYWMPGPNEARLRLVRRSLEGNPTPRRGEG